MNRRSFLLCAGSALGTTGCATTRYSSFSHPIDPADHVWTELEKTSGSVERLVQSSGETLHFENATVTDCQDRAVIMCDLITKLGYECQKSFLIDTVPDNKSMGIGPLQSDLDCPVVWKFHVAPLLLEPSIYGTPVIIDPSVARGPLNPEDWIDGLLLHKKQRSTIARHDVPKEIYKPIFDQVTKKHDGWMDGETVVSAKKSMLVSAASWMSVPQKYKNLFCPVESFQKIG